MNDHFHMFIHEGRLRYLLKAKSTDRWLQISAFVIPLIIGVFNPNTLLLTYFTVGAVQFVSCVVSRILLPSIVRAYSRTGMELLTAVILLRLSYCWLFNNVNAFLDMATILIFLGPFMAIWYFAITVREELIIKEILQAVEPNGVQR